MMMILTGRHVSDDDPQVGSGSAALRDVGRQVRGLLYTAINNYNLWFKNIVARSPFDIVGATDNPDQNTEDYLFQVRVTNIQTMVSEPSYFLLVYVSSRTLELVPIPVMV